MREELRRELTWAIAAHDAVKVSALRSALAAIANAAAVPVPPAAASSGGNGPVAGSVGGLGAGEVPQRELTPAEVEKIVTAEVDERLDAAREHEAVGRPDRAERLRAEALVLSDHCGGTLRGLDAVVRVTRPCRCAPDVDQARFTRQCDYCDTAHTSRSCVHDARQELCPECDVVPVVQLP